MMEFLKKAKNIDEVLQRVILKLISIPLISITALIGLSTLMFFPMGDHCKLEVPKIG